MTTTTTTIRKSYGNRKLYSCPEDYPIKYPKQKSGSVNNLLKKSGEDVNKLIKYIDDNIVGKSNAFLGPFGRRKGERIHLFSNVNPLYIVLNRIFANFAFWLVLKLKNDYI